jgi:cytochrome P450
MTDLSPRRADLSSLDFWRGTAEDRERAFAELREGDAVSWHAAPQSDLIPDVPPGGGFWAVTRHEDVVSVSRRPTLFCSGQGVNVEDVPPEALALFQSFLVMDDPEHKRLRTLVHSAFSPRQVRRIEDRIWARARDVVDALDPGAGAFDFVSAVAAPLPVMTLYDIWNVPRDDQQILKELVDETVGWMDPDVRAGRAPIEAMVHGAVGVRDYGKALAEERRKSPGDDLMSELIAAEIDGSRLDDEEIAGFFVLLAIAGSDTTRHTTSHAMRQLTVDMDQRAVLLEDLDGRMPTAIEEFVRWATPVMTFRRTATEDVELAGTSIAAGDKVVLMYSSANRDPAVFDDPGRFDVTRDPNKHVGFGGGGPHYCLGNQLARTQLRAVFTELLGRYPRMEVGEPDLLVSSLIHGVRHMECELDPV